MQKSPILSTGHLSETINCLIFQLLEAVIQVGENESDQNLKWKIWEMICLQSPLKKLLINSLGPRKPQLVQGYARIQDCVYGQERPDKALFPRLWLTLSFCIGRNEKLRLTANCRIIEDMPQYIHKTIGKSWETYWPIHSKQSLFNYKLITIVTHQGLQWTTHDKNKDFSEFVIKKRWQQNQQTAATSHVKEKNLIFTVSTLYENVQLPTKCKRREKRKCDS